MAKIKKAQSGLSMLAKYAGKSTARSLENTLKKSATKKVEKGIGEAASSTGFKFKTNTPVLPSWQKKQTLSDALGGAKTDFKRATTPSVQSPVSKPSAVKKGIRKDYEGLKKGGVVKKSSKKK